MQRLYQMQVFNPCHVCHACHVYLEFGARRPNSHLGGPGSNAMGKKEGSCAREVCAVQSADCLLSLAAVPFWDCFKMFQGVTRWYFELDFVCLQLLVPKCL